MNEMYLYTVAIFVLIGVLFLIGVIEYVRLHAPTTSLRKENAQDMTE